MPRRSKSPHVPKLRLHKASGQGVATLNDKDHYFGKWGDPETKRKYDEKIAEWLQRGRTLPDAGQAEESGPLRLDALAARFWSEHGKTYYLTRGEKGDRYHSARRVVRTLAARYGALPAAEFGPKRFQEFRDSYLRDHAPDPDKPGDVFPAVKRQTANSYMAYVTACIDWGVAEELLPPSSGHALRSVRTLRKGRTIAAEADPVPPAPQSAIDAILATGREPYCSLIRFQLATGARPGEACPIRLDEIDRSGDVWKYAPARHKTEHHGKQRVIRIGPRGREAIADAVRRAEATGDPRAILFPAKFDASRPISPKTYRMILYRICDALGIGRVHPNQFRHNAATEIRKGFGIDAARNLLGHSSTAMTEIYAERDDVAGDEIAARIG